MKGVPTVSQRERPGSAFLREPAEKSADAMTEPPWLWPIRQYFSPFCSSATSRCRSACPAARREVSLFCPSQTCGAKSSRESSASTSSRNIALERAARLPPALSFLRSRRKCTVYRNDGRHDRPPTKAAGSPALAASTVPRRCRFDNRASRVFPNCRTWRWEVRTRSGRSRIVSPPARLPGRRVGYRGSAMRPWNRMAPEASSTT